MPSPASVGRLLARRPVGAAYCALLVLAISYRVLPTAGILAYGDYPYFWPGRAFDPLSTMQASFFGLPRPTAMFVTWLALVPSVLSQVMPHALVAYLLIFGVLGLAAFAWLDVTRRITGRAELGYLAATMLVLSPVTMEHLVIQPSHIFAAMLALALTVDVALGIARTRACTVATGVRLALISLIVAHPLFWLVQVAATVAILLVSAFVWQVRVLRAGLASMGCVVVLHAYWLVPFVATALTSTNDAIFGGAQVAIFDELRRTTTVLSASSFLQMGGDWQARVYGGQLPLALALGVPALGAMVAALAPRMGRGRLALLVALAMYAGCLVLTLGPNAPVAGGVWMLGYAHVPGFGLLRHFTRFATYAQFASVVVAAAALVVLAAWRPRIYRVVLVALFALVLGTQWPFFTGNLNGAIGAARIPREYDELNARFLETAGDFSVVTYPNTGYEAYTWSVNPRQDVFQQFIYFQELAFAQPVAFNRYVSPELSTSIPWGARAFAYDQAFAPYEAFDDDLGRTDARYVLVHRDAYDIGGRGAVLDVSRYTDYFARDPAYRLVADNDVFALFERVDAQPRMRGEHVTVQRLNDATYRVTLRNLGAERAVTFMQHFNADWRWYPGSVTPCEPARTFEGDLVECLASVRHEGLDATRLWQRPLAAPQTLAEGYANRWVFSAASLRAQLAPDDYEAHADGSIDVTLTLQYAPQQWFYAGLIVSVVGASVLVAFGLASAVRRRLASTR